MINAYFKSTKEDSVVIVENNDTNFNLLYANYRLNSFNVYKDILIVTTDGHDLTPNYRNYSPDTTFENSRIGSDSVCKTCYVKDTCPGIRSKLKSHAHREYSDNALVEMGNIVHCPRLSVFTGSVKKPTKKELISMGFNPISTITTFINQVVGREPEYAKRVKDVYGENYNLGQLDDLKIAWLSQLVGDAYQHSDKNYLGDMCFDDDTVLVNTLKLKIKSLKRKDKKEKETRFKKSQCASCVYECNTPRLVKGLTEERLISIGSENIDSRWISLFTIMGKDLRIGRSRYMGLVPVKDGESIKIARKTPRFDTDVIPLEQYLELTGATDPSEIMFKSSDHEAACNWALNTIYNKLIGNNEINFSIDGDGGRQSRNDVLYVSLTRSGNITIGSDTRATSYGGMFSGGGSPIRANDRPRFRTDYDYPYHSGIQGWMRITPDACG